MEKLNQNMSSKTANSAQLHDSSVGMKRTLISFGGNDEKIKNLINQLKEMLNKNLNNQKMKEIKLIDGIPSTAIQKFSDSINEILDLILADNFSESIMIIDNQINNLREFFLEKLTLSLEFDLNKRLEYNDRLLIIIDDYLINIKRKGSYIRNN